MPVMSTESLSQSRARRDLEDTLSDLKRRYGMGRGLAAPQIGYQKRLILVSQRPEPIFMVNPKIVRRSAKLLDVWDSCFSFALAFFVRIPRWEEIKVSYQDELGEPQVLLAVGDLSELLQHEIDHLDGVLATDHLRSTKDILMRDEWAARHR